MTPENVQAMIAEECDMLKELLIRKNRQYGNSALEPSTVFCQAAPIEQIAVRLDDKLKRIANMGGLAKVLGSAAPDGEDTVQDLLGYLVLARVCARAEDVLPDDRCSPEALEESAKKTQEATCEAFKRHGEQWDELERQAAARDGETCPVDRPSGLKNLFAMCDTVDRIVAEKQAPSVDPIKPAYVKKTS